MVLPSKLLLSCSTITTTFPSQKQNSVFLISQKALSTCPQEPSATYPLNSHLLQKLTVQKFSLYSHILMSCIRMQPSVTSMVKEKLLSYALIKLKFYISIWSTKAIVVWLRLPSKTLKALSFMTMTVLTTPTAPLIRSVLLMYFVTL